MDKEACPFCGSTGTDTIYSETVCTGCGAVLSEDFANQIDHSARTNVNKGKPTQHSKSTVYYRNRMQSGKGSGTNVSNKVYIYGKMLKLSEERIKIASNIYEMAVHHNITTGNALVGASLYTVCQLEMLPYFLSDISEKVQVDIYKLWHKQSEISAAGSFKLPVVDPALFLLRFADALKFGNETSQVLFTALRLVQRMKRDWINIGRNPTGICAAALYISARRHDVSITTKNIVNVIKVCRQTIMKRVHEFEETPSGKLTSDLFMEIDLEEEQDPPSFKKNSCQNAQQEKKSQKATSEKIEELDDDLVEVLQMEKEFEKILKETKKHHGPCSKNFMLPEEKDLPNELIDNAAMEWDDNSGSDGTESADENHDNMFPHSQHDNKANIHNVFRPTAAKLGLTKIMDDSLQDEMKDENVDTGELDLTGIDDSEFDMHILSEEESKNKEKYWMQAHGEFHKTRLERRERKAKEEEKRNPKNNSRSEKESQKTKDVLKKKRFSHLINYDVLDNLSNDPQEG